MRMEACWGPPYSEDPGHTRMEACRGPLYSEGCGHTDAGLSRAPGWLILREPELTPVLPQLCSPPQRAILGQCIKSSERNDIWVPEKPSSEWNKSRSASAAGGRG